MFVSNSHSLLKKYLLQIIFCYNIIIKPETIVRPEREFWPEPDYYKAITWLEPEPDRHPTNLAGFLTGFDISSSVVLSNTIIGNFHSTIL